MKGSMEVKSMKLLDLRGFSLNIEFGWVFMSTILVCVLIAGIARGVVTKNIQDQYISECYRNNVTHIEASKAIQVEPDPMHLQMCLAIKKQDSQVFLDYKLWNYYEVYVKPYK